MKVYRSAMGKVVDVAALEAKNEHVRAVGNMKVNARGDKIDVHGRVIQPVNERVTENYSNTVGNRSANAYKNPVKKQVTPPKPVIPDEELTEMERELETSLEEDLEIERIKAEADKKNG